MVAIGPRVGGAHVDVNLKFDDKSLDAVGRQIRRQLERVAERNGRVYRRIGQDAVLAWRAALGATVAATPLMGGAISAVAGAATMLAGALSAVVQSSYGLVTVAGAMGVAMGTAAIGFHGFADAVKAANPEELAKALENLSPSAQKAALAVRSLRGAAHQLRMTVQERMFAGLSGEIERLGGTLFPVLEKGLGKMADALNEMFDALLKYVNSKAGLEQIALVLDNSADIFSRMSKAAVPFLDGVLRLFNALAPSGKRFADRIADIAERFQSWASGEGFAERIDEKMRKAEKTAGLLFKVLGNLGSAIANVFSATNPATNTFLEMLIDVTARFKEWTSSVEGQNTLSEWAYNAVDVMRQLGRTIESVFKVMAELSDTRLIISFLKTVGNAFDELGKLPLDKMVSAFADLTEMLEPISGKILAIIIASTAFNVLLGNLIGQVSGFVSALLSFSGAGKGIANFFKSMGGAGKHTKQMSGLTIIFRDLAGILSKGLRFAGIAGLVIWIGTIIAKSDDLKAKVGELFSAMGEVIGAVVGAFSEVMVSLKPIGSALQSIWNALSPVIDLFEKLIGLAIGQVIEQLIAYVTGFAQAIEGAANMISGFIDLLVGLFTGDTKKMTAGLKKFASGFVKILKGMFAPVTATITRVVNSVKKQWGKISGIISGVISAAVGLVKTGFELMVSTIGLVLGTAKAVILAIWDGITAVFTGALNYIGEKISEAFEFYKTLFEVGFALISEVISVAWEMIKLVFTTAWDAISLVISTAIETIKNIISTTLAVISGIVSTVMNTIRGVWSTVWGAISTTVSTIVTSIKAVLDGLWTKVQDIFDKIKNIGGGIWGWLEDGLSGVVSFVTGMLNTVIDATNAVIRGINKINPGKDIPTIGSVGGGVGRNRRSSGTRKFARGTNFAPGGMALVGEEGPELIDLPRGSKVFTASQTRRKAADGRMGNSVSYGNINVTVSVDDLAKMHKIDDFLRMLDRSRVTSRQTSRSGTVTA